ncbi:Cys-Gly metallodipeptidase DUG1 [Chlorella vulgaris]
MCRLMSYIGPPITVADVVVRPSRSIIKQSYDARERRNDSSLPFHLGYGNLNGDGFGIGWFPPEPTSAKADHTPCVFTSITPAWNNENLNRLATKLESGVIFAHVRAAYPGMPVSEQNCHPFQWGRYLFMHNGVVAGFMQIRRRLLAELTDAAYNAVQSFHSDSAVSFALFLNHLPDLHIQHPPDVLLCALQKTIATISRIQADAGVARCDISLLNFVVSDGRSLIATRYVSNADEAPASLYYAEGSGYEREQRVPEASAKLSAAAKALHGTESMEGVAGARSRPVTEESDYHLLYSDKGSRVCLVASEPVTSAANDWVEVPANTALVVCREKGGILNILLSPITLTSDCARHEEVARCLEAVNHTAAFGTSTTQHHSKQQHHHHPQLPLVRSLPSMHRLDSDRLALDAPTDSEDSGPVAVPPSPGCHHGHSYARHSAARAAANGPLASVGEDDRLTGHASSVMSLTCANGLLFSGGTDSTIRVWSLAGSKCVASLEAHRGPIRKLEIVGGRLFSAGAKTVCIWSLAPGFPCLGRIQVADLRGSVKAIAVADRMLYVGGQSCQVTAYKLDPQLLDGSSEAGEATPGRTSPDTWPALPGESCVVLRPGSGAAAAERAAKACGGPSSETIRVMVGHAQPAAAASDACHSHCGSITALAVCGPYVFSASTDSTVRVWKAGSLEFVKVLRGHQGSVLALGGRDHLIRVWDVETLVCRRTLAGHTDDILSLGGIGVAVSAPDFNQLTSPSSPSTACMVAGLSPMGPPVGPAYPQDDPSSPTAVPGSPRVGLERALLFVSAAADGAVRLWSAKCYSCLRVFYSRAVGPQPPVMSIAISDSVTIGGMHDGIIRLWRTDDAFATALTGLLGFGDGECDDSYHGGTDAAAAQAAGGSPKAPATKRVRLQPAPNEQAVAAAAAADGEAGAPVRAAGAPLPTASRLERELEKALRAFIRIRTVSADPSLHEESFRGAKFLLRLLEQLGCEVKLSQPVEDKNPIVLGRLVADPSKPTVCFYGHYDVQPAMEDSWRHDPFTLHSEDGWLYGRGTTDNKGPVLAFVYAVKELLEECKQGGSCLPANVVFLIEGEEENGSTGFHEAVQQNLRWFQGTSLVVISNTLWVGERLPCLTYGMRGMISLSIEVRGPARDLHSGNEGGVFTEPLADLSKVLASLVDSHNNILVPGFYANVRPNMLNAALQRIEASHEFSLDSYKKYLGVQQLTAGRSEQDLLTARWCQPSLSVVDVRVGTAEEQANAHYRFGPTRFSVIPKAAVGKVSIRFVPDQSASQLVDLLTAHVRHEFAKLRSPNSVAVEVHSTGDWWEAPADSPYMQMAERALHTEWGVEPLLVREGGTMPVASSLQKMLGAPALLLPMGQASDCPHLANERIRRLNLLRGKNVVKNLLVEVGKTAAALEKPQQQQQQQQPKANGVVVAVGPPSTCT